MQERLGGLAMKIFYPSDAPTAQIEHAVCKGKENLDAFARILSFIC